MDKKTRWNVSGIFILLCLVAVAILIWVNPVQANEEDRETIYEGIYLDSIAVGGLTKEEAKARYEEHINDMNEISVQFHLEDENCTLDMSELSLKADVDAAVEEAYAYGRSGNILKRYKEISDISKDNKEISVELNLDEDYLVEFLDEELSDYIVPAKDAGLEYKDGSLKLIEGTNGKELNAEETIGELLQALDSWSGETVLKVQVATNELEPEHSTDELAEVKDVIGTFETRYTLSDASRNNNIMNAASKINGSVLYPGEEFDTMAHLVPFTTENGWSYAGAYLNGEVISDIGGGICQVSTTLYNAVLNAELEVTERYPHSMAVGYVQLSADAALNEGTKNFRFVNNTDNPIFIYAYASSGTLHVSIYGKEYRDDNRTVEYKNEIVSVIPAGDPIETVDESQPSDYRKVTQTAHTGYRAKLWKYVYENGELVDTILVNTSSYSASPERVTIGKAEEEVPAETETPAEPSESSENSSADTTADPGSSDTTNSETPPSDTTNPEVPPVDPANPVPPM